ncbi:MAG TPA: DUF481 domain-containing protein [Planctomycetota bacterium]|nr:DUF481 domain-containing protein [Planctomycetota bacterium]
MRGPYYEAMRLHRTGWIAAVLLAATTGLLAEETAPVPPVAPTSPAQPAQPAVQPGIPPTVAAGTALLHLDAGNSVVVKQLMIHDNLVYGLQDGHIIQFSRDNLRAFESNAPSEAELTQGGKIAAATSLLQQSTFYFTLVDHGNVAVADRGLAGLYPPDRFMVYPDIFHKFIAPWGTLYDQRPFYLQIDLGYVMTQSVVRTDVGNAHLVVGSDIGLWRNRLEGSAHYGRTEGITTINDQSGDLKVDRYLASWLYGYAKTGLFHDDIARIQYRWTQGAGIGIGTFHLENWTGAWLASQMEYHKIDFEIGADHLNEKNHDGEKSAWFVRLAAIDQIHFKSGIDFDNKVEYLPGVSNSVDKDRGQYFVHYHSELRMHLLSDVAFRAYYNMDFNSKPPTGTPKATHQVGVSLSYSIG